MKTSISFYFILLPICSCKSVEQPANNFEKINFSIEDEKRAYWIFNPEKTTGKKLPLIVIFHGALGSGLQMSRLTDFNQIAKQEEFHAVIESYNTSSDNF
jgi:poly(3-hydroxybutyrate) depolymerase